MWLWCCECVKAVGLYLSGSLWGLLCSGTLNLLNNHSTCTSILPPSIFCILCKCMFPKFLFYVQGCRPTLQIWCPLSVWLCEITFFIALLLNFCLPVIFRFHFSPSSTIRITPHPPCHFYFSPYFIFFIKLSLEYLAPLVHPSHFVVLYPCPRCSSQLFLQLRKVRYRPRVERGRIWTHHAEPGRPFLENLLEHHWDWSPFGELIFNASCNHTSYQMSANVTIDPCRKISAVLCCNLKFIEGYFTFLW